jgi:hypothetical protein
VLDDALELEPNQSRDDSACQRGQTSASSIVERSWGLEPDGENLELGEHGHVVIDSDEMWLVFGILSRSTKLLADKRSFDNTRNVIPSN